MNEQDSPPDDEVDIDPEEDHLSLQASLNISESDSILELKKVPILKNNDKFRKQCSRHILPFAQRVNLADPYQIAFQLIQDINLVSAQVFQLWHKLVEIVTINPKFVCEYLRILYEERMREVHGEHIYRTIIEAKGDFAIPSEDNVGEIHKAIALKRRKGAASDNSDTFNVIEIGSTS